MGRLSHIGPRSMERNAALFAETGNPTPGRKLLRAWTGTAAAGGRIYDLYPYMLEAARKAGAQELMPLNPRDVAGFEGDVRIVVP